MSYVHTEFCTCDIRQLIVFLRLRSPRCSGAKRPSPPHYVSRGVRGLAERTPRPRYYIQFKRVVVIAARFPFFVNDSVLYGWWFLLVPLMVLQETYCRAVLFLQDINGICAYGIRACRNSEPSSRGLCAHHTIVQDVCEGWRTRFSTFCKMLFRLCFPVYLVHGPCCFDAGSSFLFDRFVKIIAWIFIVIWEYQ